MADILERRNVRHKHKGRRSEAEPCVQLEGPLVRGDAPGLWSISKAPRGLGNGKNVEVMESSALSNLA